MKQHLYAQLGQKERDRIFLLKTKGKNNAAIAKLLGRSKTTIGRELRRNIHKKLKRYLPDTAQRKADKRKGSGRKQKYTEKLLRLKHRIVTLLKKGWSPDLIAGRFKRSHQPYLNQESIYQFIYSKEGRKTNLRQYLRQAHRIRRMRLGRKARNRIGIPNRVDIEKRPKIVETRTEFGHWEGDNIVYNGHRKVLGTSVERKTRKVIITKPRDLTAKEKARCWIRRFRSLPVEAKRTMTYDNGREAVAHETVTASIGMKFFFAKTHAPWQRGTNENRNGLVRFYLPKDTDLNRISSGQIRHVESLINNRPMKLLHYRTPNEAFLVEMNKLAKHKLRNH